jgi:hypothetical protein
MPIYPAVALLTGCAMARSGPWMRGGFAVLAVTGLLACVAVVWILSQVWTLPSPGDISNALRLQEFDAYTLSLGHMGDLTLRSFAYLRPPLIMAGISFLVLAWSAWKRQYIGLAAAMVLFLNAARLAMITFDPYLSSRPLAEAFSRSPQGQLIVDNQYYAFSSVFFYTRPAPRALLLNGRQMNLEYGSYAPGAPDVFIDDRRFAGLWRTKDRYYLVIESPQLGRITRLVGHDRIHTVKAAGGKYLLTNDANLH